ncbi:CLUMA_CG011674, isoform A [Clunio marinus]|uniref:CLUMA_CG011674, isoform A n=1 Tax=Clunio marinus TaxID=568069 RepID=A0A1J1IDM0_9DIPT|nr:CLUMA_CG011674, isoform A [Clunio marinus]
MNFYNVSQLHHHKHFLLVDDKFSSISAHLSSSRFAIFTKTRQNSSVTKLVKF